MRLSSFSFANYRSFVDWTTVDIRPLTLFFGYNSAGKSAAMRLLPLVAASVAAEGRSPLALDSEPARGASFRDILSKLSDSPTLELGLSWSDAESRLTLRLAIRDLPDRQTQIVDRIRIASGSEDHPRTLDALWDTENPQLGAPVQRYDLKSSESASEAGQISVSALRLSGPKNRPFSALLESASSELNDVAFRTHWLNSLRAVPQRTVRFGSGAGRIAPDGTNAAQLLAHDDIVGGGLSGQVSEWFRRVTGHLLTVKRFAVGTEQHFSIVTTPPNATSIVEVPIVDAGEGMAQVFPVIVLGCLAKSGQLGDNPILAIEHPELHLHPAAHSELAAFFCTLASARSRPFILVETHSENFMLRVQIAIAQGDIPAADVVVHWVRSLDDGRSVIDQIVFDEGGRPTGWPPGVFSEDTEQAKSLLRARRERGQS